MLNTFLMFKIRQIALILLLVEARLVIGDFLKLGVYVPPLIDLVNLLGTNLLFRILQLKHRAYDLFVFNAEY